MYLSVFIFELFLFTAIISVTCFNKDQSMPTAKIAFLANVIKIM